MKNLEDIIVPSNSKYKALTRGEQLFCEAYKECSFKVMNNLLKQGIKCNEAVEDVLSEMIKNRKYNVLKVVLDGVYDSDNFDFKNHHILNSILNSISIYERNISEDNPSLDIILDNIFKSIRLDNIQDHVIVNILTTDRFHNYLGILADRGYNFKDSCLIQLSSRDGDDVLLNQSTNGFNDTCNVICYEVFDRDECEQLVNTFIKRPDVAMNLATLYPQQFYYKNNELNNCDYIGFTSDEVKTLKSLGVKLYAFRDDDYIEEGTFIIYK